MPTARLDEIRGEISKGAYAIDSSAIAAEILTKAALVRMVKRLLMSEDEGRSPVDAGRADRPERRVRAERSTPPRSRREALS